MCVFDVLIKTGFFGSACTLTTQNQRIIQYFNKMPYAGLIIVNPNAILSQIKEKNLK